MCVSITLIASVVHRLLHKRHAAALCNFNLVLRAPAFQVCAAPLLVSVPPTTTDTHTTTHRPPPLAAPASLRLALSMPEIPCADPIQPGRIEPSVQWAFPRHFLCNRAIFSKWAQSICMRGLISGLGRRDSLFLSLSLPRFLALSLSLSLWLGPVSRFGCGAGGSVYMGGWWQRSGRANGPVKSGGGRRGEAHTADQEHIH